MAKGGPYYRLWWKDLQTDEKYRAMTLAQRGAYRDLLDHNYAEGSIPADPDRLARILGITRDEFDAVWPALRLCFEPNGDGTRLTNPRMQEEIEWYDSQREAGRKGGRASGTSRAGKRTANGRSTTVERSGNDRGKQPEPEPEPDTTHTVSEGADVADTSQASVRRVFGLCRDLYGERRGSATGPGLKLTVKRASKIRARLREGFSVDDLEDCARGFYADPWEKRDQYLDPVYAFKDEATVQRFIKQYRNGQCATGPQYER